MSVKWVSISSSNGLLSVRRQPISWTNAGLLSIWLQETNCSESRIGILSISFKEMHLELWLATMVAIWSRGDELKSKYKRHFRVSVSHPFCWGMNLCTVLWIYAIVCCFDGQIKNRFCKAHTPWALVQFLTWILWAGFYDRGRQYYALYHHTGLYYCLMTGWMVLFCVFLDIVKCCMLFKFQIT